MTGAGNPTGQSEFDPAIHFLESSGHLFLPCRSLLAEAVQVARNLDALSFREGGNLLLELEKRHRGHAAQAGTTTNIVKATEGWFAKEYVLWVGSAIVLSAVESVGKAEQGVVTITHEAASATNRSRTISTADGQIVTVKTVWDEGGTKLVVNLGGTNFVWDMFDSRTARFVTLGMAFAGPATIQLWRPNQTGSFWQ